MNEVFKGGLNEWIFLVVVIVAMATFGAIRLHVVSFEIFTLAVIAIGTAITLAIALRSESTGGSAGVHTDNEPLRD